MDSVTDERPGADWSVGQDVHGGCNWGGMMDWFYHVMEKKSYRWPKKSTAEANDFGYTSDDNGNMFGGWPANQRNPKCDGYSPVDTVQVTDYYMGLAYDAFSAPAQEAKKMQWLVKYGVLSIGICASPTSFNSYTGGVVQGTNACSAGCRLDHGVATVGYGVDSGVNYWKIKNSWGTNWGENGYGRIQRGVGCLGLGQETIACVAKPSTDDGPSPTPSPQPTTQAPEPEPTPGCDESMSGNGQDYRGCQRTTRTGRTCQKWTSNEPHSHSFKPEYYPGMGLGDHNKCRNPDGDQTIWCYTTDPDYSWDYCDPLENEPPTPAPTQAPEPEPTPAPQPACNEDLSGNGQDYRGCQTKSISGKTCQKWTSNTPHTHDNHPDNIFLIHT